jgi:serine/threonine protein kinase
MDTWGFAEGDEIGPGRQAVHPLGGGRRYEAWLAWDERLRALVVAKLLRPDEADDPAARRTLEAEARMLARLAHPLLVRSFGAEPAGKRPQLVLEFVEGPRLSTLIRRFGPLETEQAAPLAVEVASALHYLHGLGLVHLDVKPKNLIMGAPPRLIDLSIARSLRNAASLTVPVGTDAYMAPEQCTPSPGRLGPAADVWGLGITLYESLVGEPAFPRGSEEDGAPAGKRFPQLTHRPAPMPSRVPSELAGAVDAALAFEPEDRPTAREMAEAVEPLLRRPRRLVLNRLKPR